MKLNRTKQHRPYKIQLKRKGEAAQVHTDKEHIAKEIDVNEDFILDKTEVTNYLQKKYILKDPSVFAVDKDNILEAFKLDIQKKPLPQRENFPSYGEVITKLKNLEKKYAGLARTYSIGKTHEGREIMALKISKDVSSDTSSKPGFLVTRHPSLKRMGIPYSKFKYWRKAPGKLWD